MEARSSNAAARSGENIARVERRRVRNRVGRLLQHVKEIRGREGKGREGVVGVQVSRAMTEAVEKCREPDTRIAIAESFESSDSDSPN